VDRKSIRPPIWRLPIFCALPQSNRLETSIIYHYVVHHTYSSLFQRQYLFWHHFFRFIISIMFIISFQVISHLNIRQNFNDIVVLFHLFCMLILSIVVEILHQNVKCFYWNIRTFFYTTNSWQLFRLFFHSFKMCVF